MPHKIRKTSPIPDASREWIENSFKWLIDRFGEQNIRTRRILTPHHSDFPIRYNGQPSTAQETLNIVATQMEVDPASIHLELYDEGNVVLSGDIYLKQYQTLNYAAGRYFGKEEDGKYHIWLEQRQLNQPEKMVATLAHEIAHIKLLGEGAIEKNDEPLTDLTTIVFGLGIFNANACFQFYKGFDGSGHSSLGYLTQQEWGYGLALLALFRKEPEADWIQLLTKNIRSDIAKSIEYIMENKAD